MENLKSAALDLRFEGEEGAALWAVLAGEIDFASAPSLQAQIMAALEQNRTNALILNLSAVQFLDSSGLRVIVQLQRDLESAGGGLVLFDPTAPVLRILALTGLDKHLQIADVPAEAERLLAPSVSKE